MKAQQKVKFQIKVTWSSSSIPDFCELHRVGWQPVVLIMHLNGVR